jgi:hypothetical protein
MLNVYEDYEGVLPMAIRLRKAGKCPGDIDNVYGAIMQEIVRMAAILLPKEDPRYTVHAKDFLSEEVQSTMLCQCLHAAEKNVDTEMGHKKVVNYLVKTVQNRLRNWVRDTEKRKEKVTILTECDLGMSMSEISDTVMTLDGTLDYGEPRCRTVTNTNNF